MPLQIDETIFKEKKQKLLNAKKVLKQEFIGLDRVINEVIDNVSAWYFMPDIQERPTIINLWGMTATGKTSLVNRLIQLLDLQDVYYRFDMGKNNFGFRFSDITDLQEAEDGLPLVIALDEFQHNRTIRQGMDVKDEQRTVWDLLDTGILYVNKYNHRWDYDTLEFINRLSKLLTKGVEVKNGIVVKGQDLYLREIDDLQEGDEIHFIPPNYYRAMIEYTSKKEGIYLEKDIENKLSKMSARESIDWLLKIQKYMSRPQKKDLSKSLIFILGNLDEAYAMSRNLSTDIDADIFYEMSEKIDVTKIKSVLQNYFYNEQISRLGNVHIIYPAIKKDSYKKIIHNLLDKYSLSIQKKSGLKIVFEQSIADLIYQEGVFPTQGVRPLFTSIQQLLKSKMGFYLTEIFNKSLQVDQLNFTFENRQMVCRYYFKNQKVWELGLPVVLNLTVLRKTKKDDQQALTAVHESGHALLSIVLLKKIPEFVYSMTTGNDRNGFMFSKNEKKFITKKDIIKHVAVYLGGLVAEQMIFGDDHITTGSESDIQAATSFLSKMYKQSGMGDHPLLYTSDMGNNFAYHEFQNPESKIYDMVNKAKKLAFETLNKENELFLELAEYLSNNRKIDKKTIQKILDKDIYKHLNKKLKTKDFYRQKLKEEIANHQNKTGNQIKMSNGTFINLNKQ